MFDFLQDVVFIGDFGYICGVKSLKSVRVAYKEVFMEYKNVADLIKKWKTLSGKESTLSRLRAMRDYAEKTLKEYPREKCADALDDNMCLIKAVVAEAESLLL